MPVARFACVLAFGPYWPALAAAIFAAGIFWALRHAEGVVQPAGLEQDRTWPTFTGALRPRAGQAGARRPSVARRATATIQDLVTYRGTDYDWRKCEARLNALPLIITHGSRSLPIKEGTSLRLRPPEP
jgi:hypothetical protein